MPPEGAGEPRLTLDLVADWHQLFANHFMVNAFLAGTLVAMVAGAVGWFMVLRGQSFAGHTLAEVGFAGATGAALVGLPPVIGLMAVGIVAALGISALTHRQRGAARAQAATIGTVQIFGLGLGLLFLRLASSSYGAGVYAVLFGTILGVSDRDVAVIALTGTFTLLVLIVVAHPLFFASVQPLTAAARGIPVRGLGTVFLVLLAVAVAQAVQIVGVLLIFALLVTPAAIAQQLTTRPGYGIALSVSLALLFTWAALTVAYYTPYPVGFVLTSCAFGTYLLIRLARLAWERRRPRTILVAPGDAT